MNHYSTPPHHASSAGKVVSLTLFIISWYRSTVPRSVSNRFGWRHYSRRPYRPESWTSHPVLHPSTPSTSRSRLICLPRAPQTPSPRLLAPLWLHTYTSHSGTFHFCKQSPLFYSNIMHTVVHNEVQLLFDYLSKYGPITIILSVLHSGEDWTLSHCFYRGLCTLDFHGSSENTNKITRVKFVIDIHLSVLNLFYYFILLSFPLLSSIPPSFSHFHCSNPNPHRYASGSAVSLAKIVRFIKLLTYLLTYF